MLVLEHSADFPDLQLVKLGEVGLILGQQFVQVGLDVIDLIVNRHSCVFDFVLFLFQEPALVRLQESS
jgi:hypothetical protein